MQADKKYRNENPVRDAAVVGLRDKNGDVFLVRTHQLPDWWQPVGGGIDPVDKTPEMAATRELAEETGIKVDESKLKLIVQTPYDFGEGTIYFFELKIDRKNTVFVIDKNEIIDSGWFSKEEALKLKAFPATHAYLNRII